MAKFFEQVKNLMSDVESLLGQVKDSKLSSSATTLKASITQQIQTLREEKPQLAANVCIEPALTANRIEVLPDDDLYEDPNDNKFVDVIKSSEEELLKKDLPASDRSNITHEGFLKYRKEKKSGLFSKSKSKVWCIIRGTIFYIYDKKMSKKQTECFIIKGYQATPMDKEGTKKDITFPFEMVCDNKKTFVFDAFTADEQGTWVNNVHQVAGIGARSRPLTVTGPPDTNAVEEDLYEDAEALLPAAGDRGRRPPAPDPAGSGQSSKTPSGESMGDDAGDLYDATEAIVSPVMDANADDIYDETGEEVPVPTSPANQSRLFSASLQRQSQILENARRPTPPPPDKALPPTPPPPDKALPPTPTPPATPPRTPPKDPDVTPTCADMYYGVWDCAGGNAKELSFRRGEVITILCKQYEDRGWWVGRLHEKVGLVPREYMTEAYERA